MTMVTKSHPTTTMTLLDAVSWSAMFALLTVVQAGHINADAVSKATSCSSSHFDCGGGVCLPARWRCDGDKDCPSGKDEEGCADCLVYSASSVRKLCIGTPNREEVLLADAAGGTIVAVDVDVTRGCVYHAEILDHAGVIKETCMDKAANSSTTTSILHSVKVRRPEGLSRDWITGNLYWLQKDGRTLQIGVTSQDGKFTKVLFRGTDLFDEPRGLAVHPGIGCLFWSDWSDVNPRIVRASMNGDQSSVTILAEGKDHLGCVNGLALDIAASKLFWTDAKLDVIGSMNLDGTERIILIQTVVRHPFGIAVSSDFIYWTDWHLDAVYSVRRTNLSEIEIVRKLSINPFGIALWAEKPALPNLPTNAEASCPYLRLLGHNSTTGKAYSQCYCPDGFHATFVNGLLDCKVATLFESTESSVDCLVYSDRTNIIKFCVGESDTEEILVRAPQRNIVHVDVDFKHKCVYYGDHFGANSRLDVVCLNQTTKTYSPPRVIRSSNFSQLEGIAYDWITGNVYWVDAGLDELQVTTNEGTFTKVLYAGTQVFDKPRGLVLHPGLGYLFWSDWSDVNPRIVRASMNGDQSSVTILAEGKDHLGWVNGLALDIPAGKVYWADARQNNMGSMNMDGSNLTTFPLIVGSHAFSVAVSSEFIYWSDWRKNGLYAVRKTNVSNIVIVKKTKGNPMGIAVWTEKPTVETADLSLATKCPYLWLLGHNTTTGIAYSQCYCPDGFDGTYVNGQLECEKPRMNNTTETNTSATVATTNPSSKLTTTNPSSKLTRTNSSSKLNTANPSSKLNTTNPPSRLTTAYSPTEVTTLNSPSEVTTVKSSSEVTTMNSPSEVTTMNPQSEVTVMNSSSKMTTNSLSDVTTMNPSSKMTTTNSPSEVTTINSSTKMTTINSPSEVTTMTSSSKMATINSPSEVTTVTSSSKMATINSPSEVTTINSPSKVTTPNSPSKVITTDSSPKVTTTKSLANCTAGQFYCGDQACIPELWRCDGEKDCNSGLDEEDCAARTCSTSEFHCGNRSCVPRVWVCDGEKDCPNGEDEQSCPINCNKDQIACENGKCIPVKFACDGDRDCVDGSDEKNCTPKAVRTCSTSEFHCGHGLCVPRVWVCDGEKDCPNGEDEQSCPTTCSKDQIACNNGKCIPVKLACDGYEDCVDGSDEKNCTRKGLACVQGQFSCSGEMCIPSASLCDGQRDCVNGADEANCSISNTTTTKNTTTTTTSTSTPVTTSPTTTVSESSVRPEDCLLYTLRKELHRICLINHTTSLLLKSNKTSVVDIDVDYVHRCVFYTAFDHIAYSVQEFCYQRWEKFTPVVGSHGAPDGLAYDWAGQNIYWLETTQKVLMVTDRMGRYRATLYSGHIFNQPRDLVLNPERGDLFWADWSNTTPAIMQASMAGDPFSVKILVENNLGWPNGLALDSKLNQLYWTDGKLQKIMMFDLNGKWMREVRDLGSPYHPFGISVSDKFIYWTDWGKISVLAVSKDAPNTSPIITVAQKLHSPNRVAVIPNEIKAPRPCSRVCPHLCLTSYNVTTREPDHVCRCADGYLPGKDRCGHFACLSTSTTAPVSTEIATMTTVPVSPQPNKPNFPFTFTTIQGKNYTELTFTCRPLRLHRLCPVQCLIQVDFEDGRPCLKCVCQ